MKLATALFILSTATAVTVSAGPPWKFVEVGYDFVGNDIGNAPGKDIDDCFTTCTTSPTYNTTCNAVSFAYGTCYFKSKRDQIIVKSAVNSTGVYTSATEPAPCAVIQQNTDYVGNDIANKPGNATDCCGICQGYPGCRAYSWNNDKGGTCWLKSVRGFVIQKQGVQAGLAYPVSSTPMSVELDTDYTDHDIGSKPSATAQGCFDICANFIGCRAFTWTNYNKGTCWLKTKRDTAIAKPGSISAVVNTVALEKGVDYAGYDMRILTTPTPEACRDSCAGYPGACVGFVWDSTTTNCYLKYAMGQPAAKDICVSGVLDPSYPKCQPGMFATGVDIVGNDLTSKHGISNPDDCPAFCKAYGPECVAYSWNNYMGGTCWLKNGTSSTTQNVEVKSCLARAG